MRLLTFGDTASPVTAAPVAPARSHPDTLGVVLSCACAAHCVALPLALAAFPAVRAAWGVAGAEGVEWAFVTASAAMGLWALGWRGWRAHRQRRPVTWFLLGLSLVFAGRRAEEQLGARASMVVVAGAALIVAAHVRNRRLLRGRTACDAPCCAPPDAGRARARRDAYRTVS